MWQWLAALQDRTFFRGWCKDRMTRRMDGWIDIWIVRLMISGMKYINTPFVFDSIVDHLYRIGLTVRSPIRRNSILNYSHARWLRGGDWITILYCLFQCVPWAKTPTVIITIVISITISYYHLYQESSSYLVAAATTYDYHNSTTQGVAHVARGCLVLRELSLHGNTHVTDASLKALATGPRQTLTSLDVNGCLRISNK